MCLKLHMQSGTPQKTRPRLHNRKSLCLNLPVPHSKAPIIISWCLRFHWRFRRRILGFGSFKVLPLQTDDVEEEVLIYTQPSTDGWIEWRVKIKDVLLLIRENKRTISLKQGIPSLIVYQYKCVSGSVHGRIRASLGIAPVNNRNNNN